VRLPARRRPQAAALGLVCPLAHRWLPGVAPGLAARRSLPGAVLPQAKGSLLV
jgi:hypothetical protein